MLQFYSFITDMVIEVWSWKISSVKRTFMELKLSAQVFLVYIYILLSQVSRVQLCAAS